ncbi:MAG: zinc ribbon domain-containing protein [Lachnospiraceae bacterium]|nr:zinc ribbon domain-containing protein [Lachnospiraceae bacterium]
MRTCVECGREVREDASFCYACGAPLTISKDEPAYMEWRAEKRRETFAREKEKRKHKIKVTVRWLIFILILLALAVYSLISPSVRTMRGAMHADEEAVAASSSKIGENALEAQLFRFFAPYCADSIVSSYNRGRTSAAHARTGLALLKQAGADEDKISKSEGSLKTLIDSRKAYLAAKKAEEAGDYAEAMAQYASVAEEDIHYQESSEKAQTMAEEYKDKILSSLGTPTTAEEYRKAISILTKAKELLPNEQDLDEKLTTYKQEYSSLMRDEVIRTAKDYTARGYYYQVITMINKVLKNNPDDEELQKMLISVTGKYDDFVKDQVSIYEENSDWDGAMKLLERVRDELPNDAVIDQLYETVKSSKNLFGVTD